ncbi:hypothetical protein L3X38_002278 [Prunus dulcis]|uniref:Transposable element protein n=1 Tax=Prunus dulcis TaxID=3755 RepID=A0AAD4WU90_PRUDU|nr:hypothetical protein L3X38_002278 [Prunus dulcis]
MLEYFSSHAYYCFLDGYSGYNQIFIAPEDQEKTTFTCSFGTFAYRRMPFGLCNALATFHRFMMAIFSDMVEQFIEVFMDDFSVFGSTFDDCLHHLPLGIEVDKLRSISYQIYCLLPQLRDFRLKEQQASPCDLLCFSRTLNDAQLNYSTTEKELLVVGFALEKFCSYLVGSKIRDKKGSENVVANYLSRIVVEEKGLDLLPLDETFPDEKLYVANTKEPWCQRMGNISRGNQMTWNNILIVELFDVWGIDCRNICSHNNVDIIINMPIEPYEIDIHTRVTIL